MDEKQKVQVVLFEFQTKDQGVVKFENWTLPAKGNYPEKSFKTLTYLDTESAKIDRLNLSDEEFSAVKWLDPKGEVVSFDETSEFFATDPSFERLPVCDFYFSEQRKGRYSTLTLVEIRLKGQNQILTETQGRE